MHKNRCATIRVFPYKLIKYLFLDRSIVVFWVVVPCSIVACYQHSGTYFFHLQGCEVRPEDGGSIFLQNVGNHLQKYTESTSMPSHLWEPQISVFRQSSMTDFNLLINSPCTSYCYILPEKNWSVLIVCYRNLCVPELPYPKDPTWDFGTSCEWAEEAWIPWLWLCWSGFRRHQWQWYCYCEEERQSEGSGRRDSFK